METLGEFGVFFILFAVGLEFSPDRIKKVKLLTVFYALFHDHTFSFCLLNTNSSSGKSFKSLKQQQQQQQQITLVIIMVSIYCDL